MRRPLRLDVLVVVKELALRAVLLVIIGCRAEIAVAMSPTPVRVMLLVALSVAAATEDTLKALLLFNKFCFAPTAAEIKVMMSVQPRYSGPVMRSLLPQTKLPLLSTDGALTAQLNVALLLVIPSLSVPPESPKRNV